MTAHTVFIWLFLLAALPQPAQAAKSYCCADERGRQACGDTLPRECFGRAYREVSERGTTLRKFEAPLSPEQKARNEAELEKKKKEERAALEEMRKNQALINTYASEKDVDFARDRALGDVENSAKEAQRKLDEVVKRKKKLDLELEFYQKKSKPPELEAQIKASESEIKVQQSAIEAKKQEMEQVRDRFEQEKKRYLELIHGGKSSLTPGKVEPK